MPPEGETAKDISGGCKEIFELLFQAKVTVSYVFVFAKHLCVTNYKFHRNLLV